MVHDLVFLLTKYLHHSVSKNVCATCKFSEMALVSLDRGYGVAQVRLAIEKKVSLRETGTASSLLRRCRPP